MQALTQDRFALKMIACPLNVKTDGEEIRSTLLVFPTANMTNGKRYPLGSEIKFVEVHPDSTMMLVVNHDPDLTSVEL